MVRHSASTSSRAQARDGQRPDRLAEDGAAVRRYLRAVVGCPTKEGDTPDRTEPEFVKAVSRWARRTGVDRKTLAELGVETQVLRKAGLAQPPANEILRRHWKPEPFSATDLARRSGIPVASVRQSLSQDEEMGLVHRVGKEGQTVMFRRTRQKRS